MTLIRGRGWLVQRNQVSEAFTGLLFSRSNNRDHIDPLGSNELRPSKAPVGPKTLTELEALAGLFQAPPPTFQDSGANRYSQQDLNKIIRTFFYASKGESSGNKLKAKTPDIY